MFGCPQKPEEVVQFLEIVVIGTREAADMGAGIQTLGLKTELQVHLTAEPSLQTPLT